MHSTTRVTPLLLLLLLALISGIHSLLHADLSSQFPPPRPQLSWDAAYELARTASSKLTFLQKTSLTTGTGLSLGPCSGNVISRIDSLNFKYLCLQDGPVGLRGVDLATVFPAGVTTASTWDRELMYLRSRAMGVENRIKGVNVALAPTAGGLGRAPEAGRTWEGFGPDPYLCGVGVGESVRGLQDEGVIACVKHWIGNEQERYRLVIETFLSGTTPPITHSLSSNIPDRALRELYSWPFHDAIHAGAGSIMCAYQRLNRTYSCESAALLRTHLKSPLPAGLGFRGFVVTDWFAAATAVPAADAGVDMVMPGDLGSAGIAAGGLPASDGAVEKGKGSRLDEMVIRILAAWYKTGQDKGWPETSFSTWSSAEWGFFVDRLYIGMINKHIPATSPFHVKIARRIAAEGTVLLKNTHGALPLSPARIRSLGVFGSDAGPIPGGPNSCGQFSACAHGTLPVGWGSGAGTYTNLIDPLLALTTYASTVNTTVDAVTNDYDYPSIATKSRNKDACLAFIKSSSGEGLANVEGNVGDRNNLTAWRDGDVLVNTVASNCANTIVVIHSVGPIIMEKWIDNPNVTAVLMAHLPGQESGNALVDILYGATNPSGKLPYTIAKSEKDYCCRVQSAYTSPAPDQEFTEGLLVDYLWFDKHNLTPRYEFGFGLSYTGFTYHPETLSISTPKPLSDTDFYETLFTVSIDISNSGVVDGKEVAQLYISLPEEMVKLPENPVRQLRGFGKIALGKGQRGKVEFAVRRRDVSFWDVVAQEWSVGKGGYRLWVGASSRDLKAEGRIEFS
ncbi:glycoside hydrolase superfamily [Tirmania nivea]|nr:glycoside hydrolase superfamily [Tirmania nivea]